MNRRYTIKANQIKTQRNNRTTTSTTGRVSIKEKVMIFPSKCQESAVDPKAPRRSSRLNTINVDLDRVSTLQEDFHSPMPEIPTLRSPSFITQVPQKLIFHSKDLRRKTGSYMPSRRKTKRLEEANSELNPLEKRSNC